MEEVCKVIEELDDEDVRINGDGSDIVDYIVEVKDTCVVEKLEGEMLERLFQYMKDDPSPNDVMYKNYETHLEGKKFRLFLPNRTKFPVDR